MNPGGLSMQIQRLAAMCAAKLIAALALGLAAVLKYLKANPDKMTLASAGNGTSDHLTAELFWQETGTKAVHVPYKGGSPALTDLLGGQVDATFMNINTGLPHVKSGKLRAL